MTEHDPPSMVARPQLLILDLCGGVQELAVEGSLTMLPLGEEKEKQIEQPHAHQPSRFSAQEGSGLPVDLVAHHFLCEASEVELDCESGQHIRGETSFSSSGTFSS